MGDYAERLSRLELMKQLRKSVGRDGLVAIDIDELVSMVGKAADRAGPLLERIPVTFKQ